MVISTKMQEFVAADSYGGTWLWLALMLQTSTLTHHGVVTATLSFEADGNAQNVGGGSQQETSIRSMLFTHLQLVTSSQKA